VGESPDTRPATSRWPPRRADMSHLLDTFLMCAVLTILIVRTELYLTNYPQVGGHGLHIAHLLWGGLLMLIAQIILLAFVVPSARIVAAVLGGIGFGLFMDEVGKFVTSDNNYFFKPSAAIMYCVFIAIFVTVRQIDRGRVFTKREYLLNAIEMVKDVPMFRLGHERRGRALAMLARAEQSDPLVPHLRRMLDDPRALHAHREWPTTRVFRRIREGLIDAVERPGFQQLVIALICVWVAALLIQIVAVTWFTTAYTHPQQVLRIGSKITNVPLGSGQRRFLWWAVTISTAVAATFAIAGLVKLVQGQRERAFVLLERALLVSIFFTQVFAFVHTQFAAVVGLLIDLGLFFAVRAVLTHDIEHRALEEAGLPDAGDLDP
jgi:hypothetical protein